MSESIPPPAAPRPVQTIKSDQARLKLTDIIAAAECGTDTIITWYGTPIAVVISYQDYIATREARPC